MQHPNQATKCWDKKIESDTSLVKTGGPSTITGANVTTWEIESWNCLSWQQTIRGRFISPAERCSYRRGTKYKTEERTWTSWGQFWAMTLLKRKQVYFWSYLWPNLFGRYGFLTKSGFLYFDVLDQLLNRTCRGGGDDPVWVTLRSHQPLNKITMMRLAMMKIADWLKCRFKK